MRKLLRICPRSMPLPPAPWSPLLPNLLRVPAQHGHLAPIARGQAEPWQLGPRSLSLDPVNEARTIMFQYQTAYQYHGLSSSGTWASSNRPHRRVAKSVLHDLSGLSNQLLRTLEVLGRPKGLSLTGEVRAGCLTKGGHSILRDASVRKEAAKASAVKPLEVPGESGWRLPSSYLWLRLSFFSLA